jgi:two-component system nitrogen regulation response regulator GlnG
MAAGREILIEDLPAELRPQSGVAPDETGDWQAALAGWATQALADGRERILDEAGPRFERTMIIAAMQHAGGKRKTAAELLGWGRNTLTRKIDELKLASRFGAE